MYKVICFDLDGTLIESINDIANSMNKVLVSNGIKPHETMEYKKFIGDGAELLVKRALGENYNEDTFIQMVEDYKRVYNENCLDQTFIYNNVIQTLTELKKKYKIAVISNKPYVDTVKVVNYYFGDLFDYVYGKKDNVEKKPHRESMDLLLDKFNISNKECLYVGDSHVDHKFALNSNVDYLLLEYGYCKDGYLEGLDAKYRISEFNKLLKLV